MTTPGADSQANVGDATAQQSSKRTFCQQHFTLMEKNDVE